MRCHEQPRGTEEDWPCTPCIGLKRPSSPGRVEAWTSQGALGVPGRLQMPRVPPQQHWHCHCSYKHLWGPEGAA